MQQSKSIKNLRQDDAFCSTSKNIIGLILDTYLFMMDLTFDMWDKLLTPLDDFPRHMRF